MICYIVWLFKRFLVQFFFNEQYYSLVSEVLTCGKYIKKKMENIVHLLDLKH